MALTPEQARVRNAIVRIGRRRGATPKELKAALETGIVESNLRNLPGGDQDSAGWRQERASLYRNPTNLKQSINRFFSETAAVRHQYPNAGDLAAAVQRPAAQYRGRYQQVSGRAEQLLKGAGAGHAGGGAGGGRRGRRGTPARTVRGPGSTSKTTTVTPAVDRSQERAALLSSFLSNKNSDIVQFALGMRDLKDTPEQRSSTSSETPGQKFRVPGTPGTRGSRGRRGRTGGRGELVHGHRLKIRGPVGNRGRISELFWQGAGGINAKDGKVVPQGFVSGHQDHVHVAAPTPAEIVRIGKMAQRMGLHVGEQPHFGPVHRVHVANSNHYSNRAIDVSGDAPKMRQFAHTVARHYGLR